MLLCNCNNFLFFISLIVIFGALFFLNKLLILLVHSFHGYQSLQSYRITIILWNQGSQVLPLALQSLISEVNSDFLNNRQFFMVAITSLFE